MKKEAAETPTEKVFETWFYEDDADKTMGIETMLYANGGKSKKAKLSDGREVITHRLKGKDQAMIKRITDGNTDKVQDAVAALSTKIDGKGIVVEDLENLWYNDYTIIQTMAGSINFM